MRSRQAPWCSDPTYHDGFSSVAETGLFVFAFELEPDVEAALAVDLVVVVAVLDVSLPPELQ